MRLCQFDTTFFNLFGKTTSYFTFLLYKIINTPTLIFAPLPLYIPIPFYHFTPKSFISHHPSESLTSKPVIFYPQN